MSDQLPETLLYTKEHEWVRREADDTIVVGITAHAVEQLGEVTMVTLPEVGSSLSVGDSFGDVDSVKAVSELYAPVDGEVVAVNEELEDAPEQVNEVPYEGGWMIKVKVAPDFDLNTLLSPAAYKAFLDE